MENQSPCPLCHAPERSQAIRHDGMDLFKCGNCRSVYMDPMPGNDTQHELYDDPYENATSGYYAKAEKKIKRSRRRAKMLSRYVHVRKRFLDIGASGGFMVEAMRELGYESHGVEPDSPGVEYARKTFPQNQYFNGLLEDVESQLEEYDAIYCSEVIEHVPDPRPFVAAIARHLKLGGVLNVTTPDISHWNKPRDIRQWEHFTPPSHCLYFSPYGLRMLLAANGIEVFRQRFNWKPGIQFYARKVYQS